MNNEDLLTAVKLATAAQVVSEALNKVLVDEEIVPDANSNVANTIVRLVVTESNR